MSAMKVATLVVAVSVLLALAWIGGELHRRNCIEAHRQGCSVLPWASGHAPRSRYLLP